MSNEVYLGIDTSNYTTSLAIIDSDGKLIANIKRPLGVKEGERGLRQSDAVFSHIKNLPDAFDEAKAILADKKIIAIGVSTKPRLADGSYMPCFLSGVASAHGIAASTGAVLYNFSHQCGHIASAIYSSGNFDLFTKDFAAFHVSGGTTELVKVHPLDMGFSVEQVGGTKDLNAGQLVDRIGVLMGMSFPCGKEMESLALKCNDKIAKKKISLEGCYVNLSGAENIASKIFSDTNDRAYVSKFVFTYIGDALIKMTDAFITKFGKTHFVYAGGVMSNSIIKNMLKERYDASFAEPALSSDNAVGVAYLAYRAHNKC